MSMLTALIRYMTSSDTQTYRQYDFSWIDDYLNRPKRSSSTFRGISFEMIAKAAATVCSRGFGEYNIKTALS